MSGEQIYPYGIIATVEPWPAEIVGIDPSAETVTLQRGQHTRKRIQESIAPTE